MNIIQLSGDMFHLASKLILIHRIFSIHSSRGLSLKTQSLYLLVFVTRYLDLFIQWVSPYNTFMKVFFIVSSSYIIYLVVGKFRPLDDEESTDTFPIQYILLSCFSLSFVINHQFTVLDIFWSFSILLEAVAILPQLHMLRRTGQAEALTWYYIIALGACRALYTPNLIYRWRYTGHLDPIAGVCGVFQTCLNFYFIYVYWKTYPPEDEVKSDPETVQLVVADDPSQKAPNPVIPVDPVVPDAAEQV